MKTKTHITTTNIIKRLTSEEMKFLAIKYQELASYHRKDLVRLESDEYQALADTYREAYEKSSGRNFIKTIYYGKGGRNRLQTR